MAIFLFTNAILYFGSSKLYNFCKRHIYLYIISLVISYASMLNEIRF